MMKCTRTRRRTRLIDEVRSAMRIEFELGDEGWEFSFDDVKRLMRDVLDAEPRRRGEHSHEASRLGVLRRMLQDERRKNGLIFIDGKPGHYRYPPTKRKESPVLDRTVSAKSTASNAAADAEIDVLGVHLKSMSKLEVVTLADLNLDLRYQLHPDTEPGRKVKLMKWIEERGGYDPNLHGAYHVNRRADGTLWTIDGGGGTWMALRCGLKKHSAYVYNLPTWEQEAALFEWLNRARRTPSKAHLFRTQGNMGMEPFATIVKIVDEAGYQIVSARGRKGMIVSTSALEFAYALDGTGAVLRKSLFDLRNSIGDGLSGKDSRLVVALAVLHAAFNIPTDELRRVILHDPINRRTAQSPDKAADELLGRARSEAAAVITGNGGRLPQPRDSNPYLVRIILQRLNYRKVGKYRLSYDRVSGLRDQVNRYIIEAGRRKDLGADVWSW